MNLVENIQEQLRKRVEAALQVARDEGQLSFQEVPPFIIEVPREKQHGDYACNVAMLLARQARMAPPRIAAMLAGYLGAAGDTLIDRVEVAGAGFINFFLKDDWLFDVPRVVWENGTKYGWAAPRGKKVQVEFVSANPTGNLHMGNARGGALGDSLANILSMAGYEVEREYYINDAGNQIELFGLSLEARYLEMCGREFQFPEGGYAGEDVAETVRHFIQHQGDSLADVEPGLRRKKLIEFALQEKLDYIKATLKEFGINYDVWFSEQSLHNSGKIEEVVNELRERGYLYEKEGAWWFKTGNGEDEKDEVVIRNNGVPTYFAADIAYHKNKFERGFDWVINIWGADHHGHVARMKAAMAALGFAPDKLDVILMQLVRLYRGGEVVRMSKRTGTLVTLNELIEEVGRDAARFFFVIRSPDSHLDFDLELAKKESQENPVYYVQYAHARICSIIRQAESAGIKLQHPAKINFRLLKEPQELDLLRKVAEFPNEILAAADTLSPHRIARYVLDLAGMFHSYYNHFRVLNEREELRDARLVLVEIVRRTIKNSLNALGVSAPERM